ncbi:YpmS family protein [Apilactobacillus apisilvae]|uniref:YpmS family protein n=1 Tax=Apilactobacillus apisilvae TaxID=2923364 RepID=A0ABY4PIS6_9LACO|nr:YpmS family protein [Apilactobacillus apisilvae]UQS85408.1 YpmS family protein [Apilactobacillus apisilvae]
MHKSHKFNIFKYLFFILIILLIAGFGYLWLQIHGSTINDYGQNKTNNDETPISVSLNKKQINTLSSYYLKNFDKHNNDSMNYKFILSDKAYVYGDIKILGSKVNYVLAMTPKMLDDGNIELDTNSLEIGHLDIPAKFVIAYVSKKYHIPNWIELNSKESKIILHLNRLGGKNKVSYQADKIDMNGNGNFIFKALVPNN